MRVWTCVVLAGLLAMPSALGAKGKPPPAAAPEAPRYQWSPDTVTCYTEGPARLTDTLAVEAAGTVQLVLPAATIQESIAIQDGGTPVERFRIVDDPLARIVTGTGRLRDVKEGIVLEWTSPAGGPAAREVGVECLVPGINWSPAYALDVVGGAEAELQFSVVLTNVVHDLEGARVTAVSGVTGGTIGVAALLSARATEAIGAQVLAGLRRRYGEPERPDGFHRYELGKQSVPDNGSSNAVFLKARAPYATHLEWNARRRDKAAVVYTVRNTAEVPLPGGTVRVYRDGEFVGSDRLDWAEVGEEVEVSVEGVAPVLVFRTFEVERDPQREYESEYHHVITYELTNRSEEAQTVTVTDRQYATAEDETFSLEPTKTDLETYEWQVELKPKETRKIERSLYTDSAYTLRLEY